MTVICGISAYYHDSAVSLIIDGEIVGAAQEERFSRIKHDSTFPSNALRSVLDQNKINITEVDYFVFYDKPLIKFERLLETFISVAPKGFSQFKKAMPVWVQDKLFLKSMLVNEFKKFDKKFEQSKLMFSEHHYSHAASAFFPSPFNEAVVLTLDGVGEWATSTIAIGKGNTLDIKKEINFPHSLGLLYSAVTYYIGFKVNSGEYKVMGLAPYGEPKYCNIFYDKIIDIKDDGSFHLNQEYFNYISGLTMTSEKFNDIFGYPVRRPDMDPIEQFHMDMAASIQVVLERILNLIIKNIRKEYGISNLCLAGGVALNCVANGKILESKEFKKIWIQPASGDAGGAIGAALGFYYHELENLREVKSLNSKDGMKGAYLGPSFKNKEIKETLDNIGAVYHEKTKEQMVSITAAQLADGNAVGWFQGRMEFGPRSLGARSILADPRTKDMQKKLNLKVKFRESFRPFAPAVLREDLNDWFECNEDSPYMLMVSSIAKKLKIDVDSEALKLFGIDKLNVVRSKIPAVTHVDYSARIQTVHRETNLIFHNLLSEFKIKTGCSLLVNTSFNVRGEPIVCTPEDAYKCFMGTGLDFLVLENFILYKDEQDKAFAQNYENKFELD